MKWIMQQVKGSSEVGLGCFLLPDPCWVGLDRLCYVQGNSAHLQHPMIIKWKLSMIYEDCKRVEAGHVKQSCQSSVEPTRVMHNVVCL